MSSYFSLLISQYAYRFKTGLVFFTLLSCLGFSSLAVSQTTVEQAGLASININKANAEQLAASLDGIGPAKAQAIVEHRKQYGNFKHVDSLEAVNGIGISTVDKNRSKITLK